MLKPKRDSASEETEETPKKKKKKKAAKSDETDDDAPSATATTASAKATATAVPAPSPIPMPEQPVVTATASTVGRSPVPTTEEWAGVGEATVLGSSKLNCETKVVREWVRVSCHGKAPERGVPTNVTLTRGGGRGDTFTFAQNEVASLVYPFFEGQHIEATFRWTRTSRHFKAHWPRGAPKPTAYGIFEGGDAHLR